MELNTNHISTAHDRSKSCAILCFTDNTTFSCGFECITITEIEVSILFNAVENNMGFDLINSIPGVVDNGIFGRRLADVVLVAGATGVTTYAAKQ